MLGRTPSPLRRRCPLIGEADVGGMAQGAPYPPTTKEMRTYDRRAETPVIVSDRTSSWRYLNQDLHISGGE